MNLSLIKQKTVFEFSISSNRFSMILKNSSNISFYDLYLQIFKTIPWQLYLILFVWSEFKVCLIKFKRFIELINFWHNPFELSNHSGICLQQFNWWFQAIFKHILIYFLVDSSSVYRVNTCTFKRKASPYPNRAYTTFWPCDLLFKYFWFANLLTNTLPFRLNSSKLDFLLPTSVF